MPLPPLEPRAIRLGLTAVDKHDAVEQAGRVLVEIGAVEEAYVDAMHERELSVSTFIGGAVAIPHGTPPSRVHVHRAALSFIQFPDGVDWGEGYTVRAAVGIASHTDEHMTVLIALAKILMDPAKAEALHKALTPDEVLALVHPDESRSGN
jgi:mannitol/fructose-specific phosphotransferase system IIA component